MSSSHELVQLTSELNVVVSTWDLDRWLWIDFLCIFMAELHKTIYLYGNLERNWEINAQKLN